MQFRFAPIPDKDVIVCLELNHFCIFGSIFFYNTEVVLM